MKVVYEKLIKERKDEWNEAWNTPPPDVKCRVMLSFINILKYEPINPSLS